MRVLVTGAHGFVGRWLTSELEAAGHLVVPAPSHTELDFGASPDLSPLIRDARPDAIAHLAAVSFGPDAERDPGRARAVNAGGTQSLFDGLDRTGSSSPVLVTSSSEVYGTQAQLPIAEDAALLADREYGRSKIEQERVSLEAQRRGRRVIVVRAFNQVGPGQRPEFVAPAFARRVLAVKRGEAADIPVGNIDVRRDFTDVRDVVRAYRLLLEALAVGRSIEGLEPPVVNVGSGRSVAIRDVLATLCEAAGVPMTTRVDPTFLRQDDMPDAYADITRLRRLITWTPEIPLERSLADLLASLEAEPA
jgi:GDP-4-dehydro-6-deoxy-D-mannose reductase